jgi:protein SCO1/2
MHQLRMIGILASIVLLAAPAVFSSVMNPPAYDPNFNKVPSQLQDVGIDQNLGAQVPLNIPFTDEAGKTVQLSDYLKKKPAILVLAYYECPMLCTLVLNSVGETSKKMSLKLGVDYQIITVSINPKETPKLAASKKASYISRYATGHEDGWHFLTGSQDSISKLAAAVGYRYKLDPKTGQYNHATDIMVLTPAGKISHYFMGIEFSARDVRLALVAASDGAIGNPMDKILIYCCNVDLTTGKYTASIWKIMQFLGFGFVLTLGGLIFVLFRFERRTV